jgi:hypothetical protein
VGMPFANDAEIVELVRRFETCEMNPADFRHYQHLTVALWYVRRFPYETASQKMREGIKQLSAAYGKMGYHETITLFWLMMVRQFALPADAGETMCDLANQLVANYDDKDLIKKYYTEELLASPEAKESWVEPDLKSLPVAVQLAPPA